MRDAVLAVLTADSTLMTVLTGGFHSAVEISRQTTPEAFDADKELLPCGLLKLGTDIPTGPFPDSSQSALMTYFYQRAGYDVIDVALARVYTLLHELHVGNGIWQILWSNHVRDAEDDALGCAMAMSTYNVFRLQP